MSLSVKLEWKGPATWQKLAPLKEAHLSGVYVWIVRDGGWPTYIGMSNSVRNRVFAEFTEILGGGWQLYEPARLVSGAIRKNGDLDPRYEPSLDKIYGAEFHNDFKQLSALAVENLKLMDVYWAEVRPLVDVRFAVESALINAARDKCPDALQNMRVSRGHDTAIAVTVRHPFPKECRLSRELPSSITYGTRASAQL